MTIVQIGKKLFPFPQQWNDLSSEQFLQVMRILTYDGDMKINIANAKFFKILSNCSWFTLLLYPLQVKDNIHLVEWIYEEQPEKLFTKNLIPWYDALYGPADELANCSAVEFFWAQHFFDAWVSGKGEENLNKLVATLYRPRRMRYNHRINPDNDHREAYNANLTELYEQLVAWWPLHVRCAIAKWFEHNFLFIRRKYPEPFVNGGQVARFGFYNLLHDVASRGTHGTFFDVERVNIYTFFTELSVIMEKDRKLN